MIDFRYHAISMVAVFLALAIGIVLGVTIGDSLVSEAEQGLRESLQEDVVEARSASQEAAAAVDDRDRLIEEALPMLVADRLRGERIAMVSVGSLPDELESSVREAVELAGGEIESVSDLPSPPDADELIEALGGRGSDVSLADGAERLGRRVGRAIALGDGTAERLTEELPDRFAGRYDGVEEVVFHRAPPAADAAAAEDDRAERFAAAVLEALSGAAGPVVGVESADADPSQIPFYERHGITSVDSADIPGGQASLVLALAGAEGDFGFKDTADDVLPDPVAEPDRRDRPNAG